MRKCIRLVTHCTFISEFIYIDDTYNHRNYRISMDMNVNVESEIENSVKIHLRILFNTRVTNYVGVCRIDSEKRNSRNRYNIIPDVFKLHFMHFTPRELLLSSLYSSLLYSTSFFLPLTSIPPAFLRFTFMFLQPLPSSSTATLLDIKPDPERAGYTAFISS